jgi:hypothetical protein
MVAATGSNVEDRRLDAIAAQRHDYFVFKKSQSLGRTFRPKFFAGRPSPRGCDTAESGAYGGAKMAPHLPFELLRGAFGLLLLYSGAQLIWDIAAPRPKAALPAGLAAVVAGIALWLFRRRGSSRDAPQSSASEGEYHI